MLKASPCATVWGGRRELSVCCIGVQFRSPRQQNLLCQRRLLGQSIRKYIPVVHFFFSCGVRAQLEPGPPCSWGFEITHTDALQSVGLLWTNDRPVAQTFTWRHTTLTSMPTARFEPVIPECNRPQTLTLFSRPLGSALVVHYCV